MPILQARPTAGGSCVLRIKDGVALKGCLSAITRRLRWREILTQAISRCILQYKSAFALSMSHRFVVNGSVKEVMPDQFVLERFKRVSCIRTVTTMQALPVNKICTTGATFTSLIV